MELIKAKVRKLIVVDENSGRNKIEVMKITGDIVKHAACKMKPNKGDVSGSYTSDAILNAPDILFQQLASVFRSWLVHGTVTVSLLVCAFLPLSHTLDLPEFQYQRWSWNMQYAPPVFKSLKKTL